VCVLSVALSEPDIASALPGRVPFSFLAAKAAQDFVRAALASMPGDLYATVIAMLHPQLPRRATILDASSKFTA